MQVLENERFRVEINEFGAELTRFTSKKDGTEYVWKGDPAAWKRHAPILFPIVGRLKDKTYTVDGKPYEITQHGFGRDLEWQALKNQRHLCGIHAHAERVHEKDVSVGFYLHRALYFGRKCAEKGAYRQEYERFRDVLRDWRP